MNKDNLVFEEMPVDDEFEEMFVDNEFEDVLYEHKTFLGSLGFDGNVLKHREEQKLLTEDDIVNLIERAREEKWEYLNLTNSGIRKLPREIGTLVDLKYLDLGNFYIRQNGDDEIDLSFFNELHYLPKEIGNLRSLVELSLYSCGIKKLPIEISNLTNLEYLNINNSMFDSFPIEIFSLENLKSLAISEVNYEIPSKINVLKNLEALYLPDMTYSTLPETLGELQNLKLLYLGRSNIESLPNSLNSLKNLKRLDLKDTPLSNKIPPEILKQTPTQIINYIIQFQEDKNKISLNESKMIIVGQGGVGKTTLLNKIVNGSYIESPSTEGIDIEKWKFKYDDNEYLMNIWDFGGQEIYHSTHQFFLTKRSLYIFVWDSRQEDEYGRIDYWLNTIQSFADDSPIIIVINKCDKDRKSTKIPDYDELKKRFPQIVDVFSVSCLDDINIFELKREIMKQSKNLPLMETVWFSSWMEIRNELEVLSIEKNIITYDDYLEICARKSIDSNEALSLITYLHDLGGVLYFHNDNLLKNIVILSPEWGTDAVYKILDSQSNILKDRNGILFYEDLEKIWSDKSKYPNNMYLYILKLMENFQLSFTLEPHKTYLIPELLSNSPNSNLVITSSESLSFRYTYKFLPAGIMTKFIVKAHEFLLDINGIKMCWRKGAYLGYNEAICKAILYDGITERYIDIEVTGGTRRDRSELLSYVRNVFKSIHENITKINYKELVPCNCSIGCEYFHNYKYLLRLERENKHTERCQISIKDVNILNLLDGIESVKEKEEKMVEINFNPIINNAPKINVSTENTLTNSNTITIEVRTNLHGMQGHVNELLAEVPDEVRPDVNRMVEALEQVEDFKTREDIVKSGSLSRIKRILEEMADSESSTGKIIAGTKYGYDILQDLALKYNKVAEWCALPIIPSVFLKK